MSFWRVCSIGVLMASSHAASAQSFNVDINTTSGFGAGVPTSTYAGAAGQPGAWNSVLSTSPATVALVNLDGSPSGVTLTRATNGAFVNTSNLTTTGNFSFLHDDYQKLTTPGTLTYTFHGIDPGSYVVFTYAANPDDAASSSQVTVPGSDSGADQLVGGAIVGNNWIPGTTHAIHMSYSPLAASTLSIQIKAESGVGAACCGGIQIVKLPLGDPFRFYVNDNAPGMNAGGSWNDAYTNLQNGLASARLIRGSNCEVWVAQGTYHPGTSRADTFLLPPELTMYGGFQGTETTLAQRQFPALYITSLSGAIGSAADTDNSYNVVTLNGALNGTVTIDGFSIVRGYASGSGSQSEGAGMWVSTTDVFNCRNCKFISNTSQGSGGAVRCGGLGVLNFHNCLFFNNRSNTTGGAMYTTTAFDALSMVNCQFLGNYALGDGGAIDANSTSGEIINTIFSGNTAGSASAAGGAAYFHNTNFTTTFRGCTFSHNLCGGGTGGVYANSNADLSFYNCILWDNANADGPGAFDDNIVVNSGAGSTYSLSFTTVQGLSGPNGLNPQFVDADGTDNIYGNSDDNLRLQLTSPCIDASDSGAVGVDVADLDADGNMSEATPLDLDLNSRRVDIASVADAGAGAAPRPDRGAYETPVPPCPGDFNADGQRNTADLVLLLAVFGRNVPPGSTGDLNGDGFVSTPDLTQFLAVFGVNCP